VLDVGCGEGVLTLRWAKALGDRPVVGLDLADPKLEAEWRTRSRPNLSFVAGRGEQLDFGEGDFDLVAAIETLEHVPNPRETLAEMRRVARRYLLVSVPREPLWRTLNLARGAYVRDLGNTPGHVNHWSRRRFGRLLSDYGEVAELRTPFPWTMALVRVG
jgi:2-polyprenyl-3-methyl-5-hydroxy-6-metoxy-1,4-benzoquinol methylase